jgi:transcriptional regulator
MRQVKGIFGFEIEIDEIQATKKLSQSRDDHNYINIISELEKTENPQSIALAKEMVKCRK